MMLTLTSQSFWSWTWIVLEGDRKVAEMRPTFLGDRADLVIEGQQFRVASESGRLLLQQQGRTVAASDRPFWGRTHEIRYSSDRYEFQPRGWLSADYVLVQEGREVGAVRRLNWWRYNANADLPEELPLPVRVFLLWLVVRQWRRQAAAAS